LDSIDIFTLGKGKTSASTSGIKVYNKKVFREKIRRLIQINVQLAQNK